MQKKSIADFAYGILKENHRPMHYRKITEELVKLKEIKAENPYQDVNASMSADCRFARYQRGKWGLVKWKYREANLPYTLTSYCLFNGTIFLTNYLKPYFCWSRDDRNIEIIFVDINGEETPALVNYRKRLIFGLKEWYTKRNLAVNDRIFIGLIDNNKRKYFIITENEINLDIEENINDIIYKALKDSGKPLKYSQIYSIIIQRETDNDGIFSSLVKNKLKNDFRYIEISKDIWGLAEWLNITDKSFKILLNADNITIFLQYLKKYFETLGYEVSYMKNYSQKIIIANAGLGCKSYSLMVFGLPGNCIKNMNQAIDWMEIRKIRDNLKIYSAILLLESIYPDELIYRAEKEGIKLYELSILYDIIKEHEKMPFSLSELQIAFNPEANPHVNTAKLLEIRKKQWEQWRAIKNIIDILRVARKEDRYLNADMIIEEIDKSKKPHNIKMAADILTKDIIKQLTLDPFRIIDITEQKNIVLVYSDLLIQRKIEQLFRFLMDKEE